MRASGASPGQFEPVRIGDELYVDGDEASPVPIHAARGLGAKVVIAVDVSAYAEDTPRPRRASGSVKDERRARQVAAEATDADILIHPNIGYYAGHTEAYRRNVIAIAERYTREKLPAIQAALARARARHRRASAQKPRLRASPRAKPRGSRRARTSPAAPSARARARPRGTRGVPAGACGHGSSRRIPIPRRPSRPPREPRP